MPASGLRRAFTRPSFSQPNCRSDFDQPRSRLAVIYLAILLASGYQEIAGRLSFCFAADPLSAPYRLQVHETVAVHREIGAMQAAGEISERVLLVRSIRLSIDLGFSAYCSPHRACVRHRLTCVRFAVCRVQVDTNHCCGRHGF